MTARLIITNASNHPNELYDFMDGEAKVVLRPGESHEVVHPFSGSGLSFEAGPEYKEVLVVVNGHTV